MKELKKLFSFDRKVQRAEFIVIYILVSLAAGGLGKIMDLNEHLPEQHLTLLFLAGLVLIIWVLAANFVARTRDTGLEARYAWLALIPFVNVIFLIYLVFKPSK
jgi:uncharacterized membrane protein YhaH (DUF805 family)